MTLAEVPAEVVAQAKVKGQEATTAFHKSCDDLEKWHGTEKVTV
jgi:Mg-chelatase subunit ChlI